MKPNPTPVETLHRKHRQGQVVGLSMQTAVVSVSSVKRLTKYGKRLTSNKHFKAHDPRGLCKMNDQVIIEECRPLSRDKRWRVVGVVK